MDEVYKQFESKKIGNKSGITIINHIVIPHNYHPFFNSL